MTEQSGWDQMIRMLNGTTNGNKDSGDNNNNPSKLIGVGHARYGLPPSDQNPFLDATNSFASLSIS